METDSTTQTAPSQEVSLEEKKPLTEWTAEEMVQWLEKVDNGSWKAYADLFGFFSGKSWAKFTLEKVATIVKTRAGDKAGAVAVAILESFENEFKGTYHIHLINISPSNQITTPTKEKENVPTKEKMPKNHQTSSI